MTTVIIPAHDEEKILGECLGRLSCGSSAPSFSVLVACNGCTDKTVEVAARYLDPSAILVIKERSKTLAINLAMGQVRTFPVFILDADVVVSSEGILRLAREMIESGKPAGTMAFYVNVNHADMIVRGFYKVHTLLNAGYHRGGSGIYGLSETAVKRVGKLPDVIADDSYVLSHFEDGEILRLEGYNTTIVSPAKTSELIQIKTRAQRGVHQLKRLYPKNSSNHRVGNARKILRLALSTKLWFSLLAYMMIRVVCRLRARWTAATDVWERDESSRRRKV